MSAEDHLTAPRTFQTERLTLVAPTRADADAIFARYAGDADVTRYLGWPRHHSVEDTKAFLAYSAAEWERSPAGPYLIRSRADGRLLGSTGLGFDRPGQTITGYVLAKDSWGQGYATEALAAMIDVSRRIDVERLVAFCHPDHRASQRVLEKCGFTRNAAWTEQVEFPNLAPGVTQDVACYELVLKKR
jgi:[ribosomal protein S5]-alanine N-acetyltransferase